MNNWTKKLYSTYKRKGIWDLLKIGIKLNLWMEQEKKQAALRVIQRPWNGHSDRMEVLAWTNAYETVFGEVDNRSKATVMLQMLLNGLSDDQRRGMPAVAWMAEDFSSDGRDTVIDVLTETLEQNGDELYQILEAAVDSSKNLDVLDRFLARTRYLALNINVKMDQVKFEANMQPPTKCRKLKFGPLDND